MNDWPLRFWQSLDVLTALAPGGLWCLFWLLAVNWKKAWPALAAGAWAPVVLLGLVATLVWSSVDGRPGNCLGVALPNFAWQFGNVSALIAVALFCGWLQGLLGWYPAEISLDPPAPAAHGHDHGHH